MKMMNTHGEYLHLYRVTARIREVYVLAADEISANLLAVIRWREAVERCQINAAGLQLYDPEAELAGMLEHDHSGVVPYGDEVAAAPAITCAEFLDLEEAKPVEGVDPRQLPLLSGELEGEAKR